VRTIQQPAIPDRDYVVTDFGAVGDVAITGRGVIDGNERHEFHGWYDKQGADRQRLRQMGFTGVPLAERVFGAGTFLRPSAI
jgi:hypothetical protein